VSVPSEQLLYLAAALFALGVLGFLVRRNVIVVLMSIELMLNAANLTFLAGARMHSTPTSSDVSGPIFAVFAIVVAAVEAAVGLALIIALYRLKRSVASDSLAEMKG
jgi:NADH-quinone oxidoreductase subunit K